MLQYQGISLRLSPPFRTGSSENKGGDSLVQILAKIQSIINDVLEGFQRAAGAKKIELFRLLKAVSKGETL